MATRAQIRARVFVASLWGLVAILQEGLIEMEQSAALEPSPEVAAYQRGIAHGAQMAAKQLSEILTNGGYPDGANINVYDEADAEAEQRECEIEAHEALYPGDTD